MGPAVNSRGVLAFVFSQLDQVAKKGSKKEPFWALASFFFFSELLKIGPNECHGPSH